jgi:hypothetical protein
MMKSQTEQIIIRQRDIQHKNTQHNDTEHKGTISETRHKKHSGLSFIMVSVAIYLSLC